MNEAMKPAPAATVKVGNATFGNDLPLASALKEIAGRLGLGLVYKSSFDKANRTSLSSARGLGLKDALPIFAEVREAMGLDYS